MLVVEHLSKRYSRDPRLVRRHGLADVFAAMDPRPGDPASLRPGEFWALRDLTFELGPGEALGVIGRNGSGKTTLLRTIQGLTPPDDGRVIRQIATAALIDIGAGFDQSASGREAISIEGRLLGMRASEVKLVEQRIIDFAELGDVIDAPLSTYSTGMLLRLGYAVIAHLEPGLLLIDEVLAVGDPGFQRKCVTFLLDYKRAGGSLVLVSHDLWQIRTLCDRCIVLDEGVIVASGPPSEAIAFYIDLVEQMKTAQVEVAHEDEEDSGNEVEMSLREGQDLVAQAPTVRIERVEVTDGAGGQARSGGRCVFDIDLLNEGRPIEATCTIVLEAEDSSVRALEFSRGAPWPIGEGTTRLQCSVEQLDLVARPYRLKIEVTSSHREGTTPEVAAEHQQRVTIADHPYEDPSPYLMMGVIGRLDVAWRAADGSHEEVITR